MRLQFAIRLTPDGPLLADWSRVAHNVRWSTGPHGFRSLRARVSRNLLSAFQFYRTAGALHVEINAGGYRVWEGRLDDPALTIGVDGWEVEIAALGYWQAYRDLPYTALWSKSGVDGWEIANDKLGGALGNSLPERFAIQTNRAFLIAPEKNSLQGSSAHPGGGTAVGAIYIQRPDKSERSIEHASFSFGVVGSSPWTADFIRLNDDLSLASGTAAPWSQVGGGSGTFSNSFAACGAIAFRFFYNGTNITFAGETGTTRAELTNIRINGDNVATISSNGIVRNMIAFVRQSNANQASASTALINAPGIDLRNEIYEDQTPASILQRLALLGDNVGNVYEVGVKRDRQLYFRARGSAARRWHVDATGLDIQQSRELLANRVYARYQDAAGRTLRTANANNTVSQSRYGLIRANAVDADTTDLSTANQIRDTALADSADPRPRAGLSFDRIYTAQGQTAPPWMIESGDLVTIRNLPSGLGADADRIRTFYVGETEYDATTRRVKIVPEEPLPSLDVLLARREAGR